MEDPCVICVGQALSSQPGKSNHASVKALPGLGHTSPNRVWKQPRASWDLGSFPWKPWYIYIGGWCGMLVPLAFSSAKPRDSGLDFIHYGYRSPGPPAPHQDQLQKHTLPLLPSGSPSGLFYGPVSSFPSFLPSHPWDLSVCPAVTSCSAFSCWTTGVLRPFLENRTGPFEIKGLNLDKHWLVGKWSGRPSSQRETDLGLGMTSPS